MAQAPEFTVNLIESEQIRPSHYGGSSNLYEAIKVIEAWGLNFSLGNAVKYICRAGKKPAKLDVTTNGDSERRFVEGHPDLSTHIEDLKKARTYLDFEIARLERTRVKLCPRHKVPIQPESACPECIKDEKYPNRNASNWTD
jgi:hypothetical protein